MADEAARELMRSGTFRPGAFASRGKYMCTDPDCADCAAEFECVACVDEGGVLV